MPALFLTFFGCHNVNLNERMSPRQTLQRKIGEKCDTLVLDYFPEIRGGILELRKKTTLPKKFVDSNLNELQVFVSVKIDSLGIPLEVKIVDSVGLGCDEEATKLAMELKYFPAIRCGKPIESILVYQIDFVKDKFQYISPITNNFISNRYANSFLGHLNISSANPKYKIQVLPHLDEIKYGTYAPIPVKLYNRQFVLYGDVSGYLFFAKRYGTTYYVKVIEESTKRMVHGLLYVAQIETGILNDKLFSIEINDELFNQALNDKVVYSSYMAKVPPNIRMYAEETPITEFAVFVLWYSKKPFGYWQF